MGDWPQLMEGQRIADVGTVTASSIGTAVTSSASVNTKGTWTQLIASTAFDSSSLGLIIPIQQSSVGVLFDLGVGAAAAEQVVVPNIYLFGSSTAGITSEFIPLPVPIPAGVRVSARSAASTGSTGATVIVYLIA